jgi:hypothetical protein
MRYNERLSRTALGLRHPRGQRYMQFVMTRSLRDELVYTTLEVLKRTFEMQ